MAYKSAFTELDNHLMELCKIGNLHYIEETNTFRAVASKFNLDWYHVKPFVPECMYWNAIMSIFGKGNSFVPIRCQNCWKVVAKPRTLKELYQVLDIQKAIDIPSKCGIEQREYVPSHYGAYWYNETKEDGMDCYENVRKQVSECISKDVPVILKRGCTEYEQGVNGPSDKWKPFEGQHKYEEYIKAKIELMKANEGQSEFLKTMVKDKWNRFAHSRGDFSYVEFNDGKLLYPKYVTYHKE